VTLSGRDPDEIAGLRACRENLRYMPGFVIPSDVRFALLGEQPQEPELTVVAVPSGAVREMIRHHSPGSAPIVVCSKGLEVATSLMMTQVVAEIHPAAEAGVLSGPNLAVEIVRGIPTVAISAFLRRSTAEFVQRAFNCGSFRVSLSDDVVGIELGGALKNVLAIGAGMSDGLGFGDNTKGAFLSRGLMEMARLGDAMGGRPNTFLGPAGVGDLFATANSRLSRNYQLGQLLGAGEQLLPALHEIGQVVEGVPTSEAAQVLARKHQVDMPVFAAVEGVIRGHLKPQQAVALLMEKAPRANDFLGGENGSGINA
jgi:glycerol-3-phosphate dehydrogenase (NAD(P)+)